MRTWMSKSRQSVLIQAVDPTSLPELMTMSRVGMPPRIVPIWEDTNRYEKGGADSVVALHLRGFQRSVRHVANALDPVEASYGHPATRCQERAKADERPGQGDLGGCEGLPTRDPD